MNRFEESLRAMLKGVKENEEVRKKLEELDRKLVALEHISKHQL
jgi:hypothetical protein